MKKPSLLYKFGLLFLFIFVAFFIFNLSLQFGYNRYFNKYFFIVYFILMILILIDHSKKMLVILSTLITIYVLITIIPFPICHHGEYVNDSYLIDKDCICVGVEKQRWQFAGSPPTHCVGMIKEYKTTCHEFVPHEFPGHIGYYKEVPCMK